MKYKKIILIILLLFLTSCKEEIKNKELTNELIDEPIVKTSTEPVYVDENPITIGLYQNGSLVKEISAPIINLNDIASFDVYFTNEESLGSSNTKANFNRFYEDITDKEKYKIGFYISFNLGDTIKEGNILGPEDMYVVTPYIYNYLYDDIHQTSAWYSHIEEGEVKDDTVFSSIKLFAAENTEEITSPITLTVFTYDTEDDFDENGKYRGNSKYTIKINRK